MPSGGRRRIPANAVAIWSKGHMGRPLGFLRRAPYPTLSQMCIIIHSPSSLQSCASEWFQSSSSWWVIWVFDMGQSNKGSTCTFA